MSKSLPPLPTDEPGRLATLRRLDLLDTLPEQAYDDLTVLASQVCGTPIAMVALIDEDRQWYKSVIGTPLRETSRNDAFCAHAILRPDEIFTVADATTDPRFVDNPFVTGAPHIRFYAGAPIVMSSGHAIGTLCVIDAVPRTLTDAQRACLTALARQASLLLDLREKAMVSERLARENEKTTVDARLKQKRGMELLELVLRGGQMGLWDLHVPSGVWTVNAREHAMLGYAGVEKPPETLDWRSLVHGDDWQRLTDAMEPHLNGRASFYECTHRMRHADGHDLWVLDRGVIVERDVRGDPVRIVGTHVDVTEQKRRDDAQARDAERLELALGSGDQGLWDWDLASDVVVRSSRWRRLLGYTQREIDACVDPGGFRDTVVHPDDRGRWADAMAAHLAGETPVFEIEVRMRRKDGRWTWMLDRGKVVERDHHGAPTRVVGTSTDVTARKNDELALARAAELLVRTGRMARVGGWRLDVASSRVTWSDEVYRLHDLDPGEKLDLTRTVGFFVAESRARLQAALAAAIADATPWDLELCLVTALGRRVWIRTLCDPERVDGTVTQLFGTAQDITERREAEARRVESDRRLRGITDNVPALIAEIGPDGRFRFANETYRTWLGVDPASLVGRTVVDAVGAEHYAVRGPHLERALRGERASFEQTLQLPAGERCLQTTYEPHRDAGGTVVGVYALTSDVTALKVTQRELDRLARFDTLTGLANRRRFEETLQEAMARTRRTGVALAVLYLDIDRFKSINDRHGHAVGDAVLVEFGRRLVRTVRETDLVARHAGDEFVVVLEGVADAAEARVVAQKLVATVRPPFVLPDRSVDVTTSVGVAVFTGGMSEMPALLSLADGALYDAKSRGRDCVGVAA